MVAVLSKIEQELNGIIPLPNYEESPVMTIAEVARELHLHPNTVRRWSRQGILKFYRVGPRRDRRYRKVDILEFIEGGNYGDCIQREAS